MSAADRCDTPLAYWAHPAVTSPCARPAGHDGDHWPVPLAGDEAVST